MTLHELETPSAVSTFLTSNPNTLICFSATWCGPCKRSKPDLIAMADSYQQDASKDIKFGIIYEHKVGNECVHGYGIRAFPTYLLFVKNGSQQFGKVEGANMTKIRDLIEQAGCQKDFGVGNSLGGEGGGKAISQEDARALRLQKLGAAPASSSTSTNEKTTDNSTETQAASTDDVEMKDAEGDKSNEKKEENTEENTDPTAKLDKEVLDQLTSGMGFSLLRAQKGLLYGQEQTLEGAVEWLMNHQDDADIDDPIPTTAPVTSKGEITYKCMETGKLFSNMADLELYANRTGRSNFEECTEQIKPLTPEEKAERILKVKRLLKAKRTERETAEKKDNIEREKQRRFMGKEMIKTQETMEIEKRKRDAKLRKKAKEEEKRERERLRRELAKDKAERMANKGKLSSRLGVEGYNPDGIQYDVDDGNPMDVDASKPKAKKKTGDAAKIDEYIKKVSSYRAGGDGKKCLKILLAYVGNVADNPEEEKFKSIKTDNKVYKQKVKPFVGAKSLLMAVGFQQSDDGNTLKLNEDADQEILSATKIKLQSAMEKY